MPTFRKTTLTEMYRYVNSFEWLRDGSVPQDFTQAVCVCRKNFAEPGGGGSPIPGPHIHTREGAHLVTDGDWIAKGPKGEFYPIKDDVHQASYEEVK